MAQLGLQFTPCVTLADQNQAVLMEVQASLRLWGGQDHLLQRIGHAWQAFGWQDPDRITTAAAPTARAALWIALSSAWQAATLSNSARSAPTDPTIVVSASTLADALHALPLTHIPELHAHTVLLDRMGIRTLGQLEKLPRAGLTRRFGRPLLHVLDTAFGRSPDPHTWITAPDTFAQRRELAARAEHVPMMEHALLCLLHELSGWLHARQAGIERFTVVMHHDDPPPTTLTLGLASTTRDLQRFAQVLHERLARFELPRPVYDVEVQVDQTTPLAHQTMGFLADAAAPGTTGSRSIMPTALVELMERLQARLGATQIHYLHHHNDHRPEHACTLAHSAAPSAAPWSVQPDTPHRPTWLLTAPLPLTVKAHRPVYYGPLQLLCGPERIEAGWWEDCAQQQVQRDYFIARSLHDELLWVFRTPAHQWYLHGFFS